MYKGSALGILGILFACLAVAAWATDQKTQVTSKTVQAQCSRCHSLGRVKRETLDAKGWQAIIERMVRHGAQVPNDQVAAMASFLAKYAGKL